MILGFWYLSWFLLLQLCCAPRCRWGAMCLVGCCACFAGCAVAASDAAATEGRGRIYLSVGGRATLSGVWGAVVEAVTAAAWPMGEPSGGSAAARQARARAWRGGVRVGGGEECYISIALVSLILGIVSRAGGLVFQTFSVLDFSIDFRRQPKKILILRCPSSHFLPWNLQQWREIPVRRNRACLPDFAGDVGSGAASSGHLLLLDRLMGLVFGEGWRPPAGLLALSRRLPAVALGRPKNQQRSRPPH